MDEIIDLTQATPSPITKRKSGIYTSNIFTIN